MRLSQILLFALLTGLASSGLVISLSNAAPECSTSDPCAAKDRYEKAVEREKVLNKKVLAYTPKGKTPAGNAADWQKMIENLTQSGYLNRATLDTLSKDWREKIAGYKAEEASWNDQASEMNKQVKYWQARITELERSNLTEAGKKKLAEAKKEVEHYEAARESRLDQAAEIRGKARTIQIQLDRLNKDYRRVEQVENLQNWIRYDSIHDEWEKADDDLEAAKRDNEAGIAEKNQRMAKAKSAYDQALADLAKANSELQGLPKDERYNNLMKALISRMSQKLSQAEQDLAGLDCFADAKALRDRMRAQRTALANVKLGTGTSSTNTQQKPPTTPPSGAGVFKLTKKEVGHVPGPDKGPYGTWSGSIGESTFSATYQTTSSYEFNANLTANWTVPPDTLKPGDTVELGVTTSGSVTGKDRGAVGLSAGWEVGGSVTVISNTRAFSGISESGKEYGGGSGAVKFKVGTGGTITIASNRGGVSWGSGGNFTPCVYTYTFSK